MTEFKTLKLDIDARGVAWIILARPDKRNAMDEVMITELATAARRLGDDPVVRAVVLAGQGKSFCAGGDLDWMRRQSTQDRAGKVAQSMSLAHMLRDLDALPKPLIGRVHGDAYGGGIGLMSVCDMVFALSDTKFGLTEVRLGLIPANISPYVVRRLGEGAARRVFFTGRLFDAHEALTLGLVAGVADDLAGLDARIEEELSWILHCAPGAVADAKALCLDVARASDGARTAIDDLPRWTGEKLADRWDTAEGREGIRCFFDRQTPPWRG